MLTSIIIAGVIYKFRKLNNFTIISQALLQKRENKLFRYSEKWMDKSMYAVFPEEPE